MAVGYSRTKPDLDARIGSMVLALRAQMTDVDRLAELVEALGAAGLQAMGYTTEDVALLQQVVTDMVDLVAVARGEATVPEARDFTAASKQVMGVQ